MKKILTFFSICILTACQEEIPQLPVEEDKLVLALSDVHIAESALQGVDPKLKDSLENLYFDQIFTIHNIAREDWEKSVEILKEHPDISVRVYEKVNAQLNRLKAEHAPYDDGYE